MSLSADSPFITKDGRTFEFDKTLPSLPVPPLEQTLRKYLDSVKPHLSTADYQETEKIVQKFGHGVGKGLHEKLVQRSKTHKNWLEKWWEDKAYLEGRYPISPLVNFVGPAPYMLDIWPPEEGTQIERAAIGLWYNMKFWQLLRREKLQPNSTANKEHLSMDQFHRAYNTYHYPGESIDRLQHSFNTVLEGATNTNIVVLCRGHIFLLNPIDQSEEPFTAPELQVQLQHIRDTCDRLPWGPGLGAMTAEDRTVWYKTREHLVRLHPQNAENLKLVEESMMCLVLDERSPTNFTQASTEALTGEATNRWFEKSMTLLFFKNGTIACNCDHAPFDAMVLIASTAFVDYELHMTGGKWQGSLEVRELEKPRQLVFHLDDIMYKAINNAIATYSMYASNIEVLNPHFPDYGKTWLRRHKLHPDAHIQVALQYAYYSIYKKPAPTYETATTRKFYNGRTETVRSCSMETLNFSKAMLDTNVTADQRYKLLHEAYAKQIQLMDEASNNEGCDRHLFGLKVLAEEAGLSTPEIYTNKAWKASGGDGNFILSTSFVGYTRVFGGVGPMCTNGYGCFYNIWPKRIQFFISTWKSDKETGAVLFFNEILKCLRDMKTLIEANSAVSAKL